jgi:hypothetical protein
MHLASIYSIGCFETQVNTLMEGGSPSTPEVAVSRWDSKCMKIYHMTIAH